MSRTTRRTFLKQTGLFSSSLFLIPSMLANHKYKLELQLYSIRDAMEEDVQATLKKIASYGYEEAETYGFDKKYYGMEARDFKTLLEDTNLITPAGHFDLDKFLLPGKTKDDLIRYVDDCRGIIMCPIL